MKKTSWATTRPAMYLLLTGSVGSANQWWSCESSGDLRVVGRRQLAVRASGRAHESSYSAGPLNLSSSVTRFSCAFQ